MIETSTKEITLNLYSVTINLFLEGRVNEFNVYELKEYKFNIKSGDCIRLSGSKIVNGVILYKTVENQYRIARDEDKVAIIFQHIICDENNLLKYKADRVINKLNNLNNLYVLDRYITKVLDDNLQTLDNTSVAMFDTNGGGML